MTVQLNLLFLTLIFFSTLGMVVAYFTNNDNISGIPYPVIADVGTKGI